MRGQILRYVAGAIAVVLAAPAAATAAKRDLSVEVLSNRADLISGGDALVQIDGAGGARLAVDVDGRDVTSTFSGTSSALVTGLADGPNALTAAAPDGRGARITITNHPIGGPIFAGPQVQPWVCTTADTASARRRTRSATRRRRSATSTRTRPGPVRRLRPGQPAGRRGHRDDDDRPGQDGPLHRAQENGDQDRGMYAIAVLADRSRRARRWNHKLLTYPSAPSTAPDHSAVRAPPPCSTTARSRAGSWSPNSSMNVHGQNANDNVSAEALMMLKEHIVERYGAIRYTIGKGCSGGRTSST